MEAAAEICREDGGPACYLPAIAQDLEMIRRLRAGTGDYRSFLQELEAASFGRLAAARSKDIVPEKKEAAGRIRERAKKTVTALKELYGLGEPEQIRRDLKTSAEAVRCLLDLAEEFDRRYQEAKKDKNLVGFRRSGALRPAGAGPAGKRTPGLYGDGGSAEPPVPGKSWWTSTRTATTCRRR